MKFRDVSTPLKILRDILLGRKYPLSLHHNRYNPMVAPRTLPPPDIRRCPDDGYANKYYYARSPINSVHPPVVVPIALGLEQTKKICGGKPPKAPKGPSELVFPDTPTPGQAWWWDGHCYFECGPDHNSCENKPMKKSKK